MSVRIRCGVPEDATQLAAFAAQTFTDTFGADNHPDDLALHLATSYGHSQQSAELTDPSMTTLLAEADGRLAGFAQLRSRATPACVTGEEPIELMRFYVGREWHGRGLAQSLMSNVLDVAASRGARTLWLGVWERNQRAQAFYRKAGFTDAGSHVFMVGTDPQTDRIMARPVTRVDSGTSRSTYP